MIYLKAVDKVFGLLTMYIIAKVFFLCVLSQNPIVHQGLCHCGMQICIHIFVRKEEKERSEEERGIQPLQMLRNCTEQMNINVTVKLK